VALLLLLMVVWSDLARPIEAKEKFWKKFRRVLGGAVAGVIGVGLTIATGGAAAPVIPALVYGAMEGAVKAAATGTVRAEVNVPLGAPPSPARQQPSLSFSQQQSSLHQVGAAPIPEASGTYTHKEALDLLSREGITVASSGKCSDRNSKTCTSLDEIRKSTIKGLIEFKNLVKSDLTVTAGTENGHTAGKFSHGNGYKFDLRKNDEVTEYIEKNFKSVGRNLWADGNNFFLKEGDHWDVTIGKLE